MEFENVEYVSVWNDGFEVVTTAKLNRDTGEVYDIQGSDIETDYDGDELEFFEGEFIEYSNGERAEVEETNGVYFLVK